MADPKWGYDPRAHRYRDLSTGRWLPKRTVTDIRDRVTDAAGVEARSLAERAVRGEITPDAFRQQMRVVVRNAHAAEAIFGRGGVNSMTSADFGRLGRTLRQAYARLETLVLSVETQTVSEAQAANRAQMAVNGATLSFEQAQAASWGLQLPVMPADGGTPCLSNCKCAWQIKETDTAIEARWRVEANPCSGCAQRAATYNPYSVPKWHAQPDATPVRLTAIRRVA